MKAESCWGSKFFKNLSKDLKEANPKATCFSPTNLLYMKNFYCMYQSYFEFGQQVADQIQNGKNAQQLVEQNKENEITQQVAEQIWKDIFSIPWGHHMLLIDKFLSNPEKLEGTMPTIEEIEAKLARNEIWQVRLAKFIYR